MKISSFKLASICIIALLCCTYLTNEATAKNGLTNNSSSIISTSNDKNVEDKQVYYNRTRSKVIVTITSDLAEEATIKENATGSVNKIFGKLLNKTKTTPLVSGIHDVAFSPDFEEGYFYLSFASEEEEATQVIILDVAGKELHSETIEAFAGVYESKVNIVAEAKGTFFLKIKQGLNLVNKKIEVE